MYMLKNELRLLYFTYPGSHYYLYLVSAAAVFLHNKHMHIHNELTQLNLSSFIAPTKRNLAQHMPFDFRLFYAYINIDE